MPARHRIATLVLLSSTVASAHPGVHAPPPPDYKVAPALLKLRSELSELAHDAAIAALPRFRALCDADGYPLVGNIATKAEITQPSDACRLLRERAKSKRAREQ